MSNWKIIVPMATVNLIVNTSFENGTTSWSTLGTNTIESSVLQQKYGIYSALITYGNNDTLIQETINPLPTASTDYFLSAWVYVPAGYDGTVLRLEATGFSGSSEVYTTVFTVGTDPFDKWIRLSTVVSIAADLAGAFRLTDTGSPTAAKELYTDAWQVEETTALTTYCDGDQPGCRWDGTRSSKTSSRPLTTRLGGVVKDLEDDFGLPVERMIGTGATPMTTITTPRALLPGKEWQRSIAGSRVFSLVCTFRGSDLPDYHAQRQVLITALAPDGVGLSDPVVLRYTGAAVDKQIQARYIGGLEMAGPRGFAETIALRFQADDPFFEQIGNQARGMFTETAQFTQVASRVNGQWSNMGPPHTSGIYSQISAIAVSPTTGKVYFGGSFTNFDNITNADFVVEWDPETETWAALAETAGGIDDHVRGLTFDSKGVLYAVGDWFNADGVANADYIAQWDGTGWTAVGDPGDAGAATVTSVDCCHWATDGNFYVGGAFGGLGGDADADNIAKWDGTSWSNVGGGAGSVVRVIDSDSAGTIYIGGDFTSVDATNSTAANRIARFVKGVTWQPLGSGFTNRVRGMSIDASKGLVYAFGDFVSNGNTVPMARSAVFKGSWRPMGEGLDAIAWAATTTPVRRDIIIGGQFTTVNDVETPDGLAIWNGSSWLPLDLSIEGGPIFYATHSTTTRLSSGFGPWRLRDDLYVGGDFDDDTGTYPVKTTTVINGGTARVYPIVKLSRSGGTSSKITKLTNTTTDKDVYLNYDLLDGETITLDFRPGYISMSSDVGGPGTIQDRWDILPQSILADFYLLPGRNDFTMFYTALGGATVTATIQWSDTFWSVD